MALTSYADFKKRWLGDRVDTDGIPVGSKYQCVDLIKQYLKAHDGIPYGAYGNAIDYWFKTAPIILTKFEKHATSKVRRGDIVVMQGVSGAGYGHIGLADAKYIPYYPYFKILEQNGATGAGQGTGGDAIRTKYKPRSRIVGVLRHKG